MGLFIFVLELEKIVSSIFILDISLLTNNKNLRIMNSFSLFEEKNKFIIGIILNIKI